MGNSGRILIVDDSRTVRLKLKKAVETIGYEAVAVGSGLAALEQIRSGSFDLMLLDIVMPGIDGFEMLRLIKTLHAARNLPVIVISSLDDDMNSVVKAIELGAEDFMPKEFESVLLKARVSACIEKKRLRDRDLDYLRLMLDWVPAKPSV